jgi:hypothetical protein
MHTHTYTYTHPPPTIRRTPADDAIKGGYWKCAKLLLSNGAPLTIELSDKARRKLQEVDLIDVRREVGGEKVRVYKVIYI